MSSSSVISNVDWDVLGAKMNKHQAKKEKKKWERRNQIFEWWMETMARDWCGGNVV